MSLANKIDKYRVLKRIAAENRHLHARLVNSFFPESALQRTFHAANKSTPKSKPLNSPLLRTRPLDKTGGWFESSVSLRVHERCHLLAAVNRSNSSEVSKLSALSEALFIIPTSCEWSRILMVFDSDAFASFTHLLACLNATATVQLTHDLFPCNAYGGSVASLDIHRSKQQFKATVSVELAAIDEALPESVLRANVSSSLHVPCADVVPCNKEDMRIVRSTPPVNYDFGVSGDWAFSVRDAIRLALAKSCKALEELVVEEWHGIGKEAALLLNELQLGGSTTSEMDVKRLDAALDSRSTPASMLFKRDNVSSGIDSRIVWTVCSQQQTSEDSRTISDETAEHVSLVSDSNRKNFFVWAAEAACTQRVLLASGKEDLKKVVVEYATCTVPFPLLRERQTDCFAACDAGEKQFRDQGSWLPKCTPDAVLMHIAVQKSALYRYYFSVGDKELHDLSRESGNGFSIATTACKRASLEATWCSLPPCAGLCHSAPTDSTSAEPSSVVDCVSHRNFRTRFKAVMQNSWHCPDVVAMLAMVRWTLRLPYNSFPEVRFDQKAVHDPMRRVRQLAAGAYGDVDVFTKVHIEWTTPRGTFVASAESDPSRHSPERIERKGRAPLWTSGDTGYQRGPLPLLVAAVCSLFDQVMRTCLSASHRYPVISVQSPFSRRGLDFLFYSWFGATPQVRCFAIGTAVPQVESALNDNLDSLSTPDGFTSCEVRPSMTRAMLFYDVLGQRVLFAETHARNLADAVARLDKLAVEVNQIQQDVWAPASAVTERPFRSVQQFKRWQAGQEDFLRVARAFVAPPAFKKPPTTQTNTSRSPAQPLTTLGRLLQRCIASCNSELSALWTVVEVVAKVVVTGRACDTSHASTMAKGSDFAARASGVLAACYTPDHLFAMCTTAEPRSLDEEVELTLWLGRRHVPWNCRPLGKEAMPPSSGVVELRLSLLSSTLGEDTTVSLCGVRSSSVTFRCRIAPLSSSGRISNSEGGTNGDQAPTGILPALTRLCREALQYVWEESEAHCKDLVDQLPAVEEVLQWCAKADPVLAREADGFPPYDAGFYSGVKLLGELLQGITGKYSCTYAAVPLIHTNAVSPAVGGSTGVSVEACASPQPSTVFYRSEPMSVDLKDNEDVDSEGDRWLLKSGWDHEALSVPPTVECTVFVDSIMGSHCINEGRDRAPSCPLSGTLAAGHSLPAESNFAALNPVNFTLGRGVGRTKREAWRSAAWQALRLQFPHVLAQVEVLRGVTDLLHHPDQLNLLINARCNVSAGSVGDTIADFQPRRQQKPAARSIQQPTFPVCGLAWNWRTSRSFTAPCWRSSGRSSKPSGRSNDAALSTSVACSVKLMFADDTQAALPTVTAAAATAGEAYVLAGQKLLRLALEAQREGQAFFSSSFHQSASPTSPLSSTPWESAAAWWPVGSNFIAACTTETAGSGTPHQLSNDYYATWRPTTFYTRSIWHAYAGALSVYFGEDVVVELLCEMQDANESENDDESGDGSLSGRGKGSVSESFLLEDQLSAVQVRARQETNEGVDGFSIEERGPTSHLSGGFGSSASARHDPERKKGDERANKLLFRYPTTSLLARRKTQQQQQQQQQPRSDSSVAKATTQSFEVLRATSRWLADLVEQCAMPQQTRAELQGLVRSRLIDLQRTQCTSRVRHTKRLEVMARLWTGCYAEVHLRRSALASFSSLPSSSPVAFHRETAWVAELHLRVHVTRPRSSNRSRREGSGVASRGRGFFSQITARGLESGMWVAGRAAGSTSDEAVWHLYRELCKAVGDLARELSQCKNKE